MQIERNGQTVETEAQTAFGAAGVGAGQPGGPVVILNGFQLREDHPLSPGDSLFVIPKGEMPSQAHLEAMMAARHTPGVHEKVKRARVAIAGLGGLGPHIAASLARLGVGSLLLVDWDIVEPSNLNRQNYTIRHLGKPKTEATREQLGEINPFIQVETVHRRVTGENGAELFAGWPIVCEAFDDPAAKAMLVSTLLAMDTPPKVVAASGMAGFGPANTIETRRVLPNLYLCGDMETGAAPGMGLMAPRVQVCAGHQANQVLRLILGLED